MMRILLEINIIKILDSDKILTVFNAQVTSDGLLDFFSFWGFSEDLLKAHDGTKEVGNEQQDSDWQAHVVVDEIIWSLVLGDDVLG